MKFSKAFLMLMSLVATAACAQSEPVTADPEEIEAAVEDANEAAASVKNDQASPKAAESL